MDTNSLFDFSDEDATIPDLVIPDADDEPTIVDRVCAKPMAEMIAEHDAKPTLRIRPLRNR